MSSSTIVTNAKTAKEKAVNEVLKLIAFAFCIAIFIGYFLTKIISLILTPGQTISDIKSVIEIILLLLGGGRLLLLVNSLETTINNAIDEEIAKYKAENLERLQKQEQEYCYSIPEPVRSEESPYIGNKYSVVERRAACDAIIKRWADNDTFLNQMVAIGIVPVLGKSKNEETPKEKKERDILINDIFVYLKAWLMFSIRYGYPMPFNYIKQSYSGKNSKESYLTALNEIRVSIRKQFVIDNLDRKYLDLQIEILEEYLDKLIKLIEEMKK